MSEPAFNPDLTFAELGVRRELQRALSARRIVHPFPIQEASLPDSLSGRDVLGRGRTGSGKTVAFALPLISRLLDAGARRDPGRPRALILVPTRELAVQVHETVDALAAAVRLKTMTVFGGVRYTGQIRRLERGVDIVIATPGRLEDLIEQGALRLEGVEVTVLDEADLMADMGFMPAVTRILDQVPSGQKLLFSATLDNEVGTLVKRYLHDPVEHSVDAEQATPETEHYVFLVSHENKSEVLHEMLTGGGRTLAFTRTKFGAERLARQLTQAGIPAEDLHGNLSQAKRQRHLAAFADGSVSVLVATDIAARGIHVDDIGLVVHVDPPNDPKAFLHRSGRTARAGAEGTVVTLATRNQNKLVRALLSQAHIKPTSIVVTPGHEAIERVRAPKIEPRLQRGASFFEPDPEDAVDDRSDQRERAERPRRDAGRSRRPRDAERPGREPRSHPAGGYGKRPEWQHRAPRDDRSAGRPQRGPQWRDVETAEPHGARGWLEFESGEQPTSRDARATRGGRPGRATPSGRGARWEDRRDAPAPRVPREERRTSDGRPTRVSKSGEAAKTPARKKARWTADDRRKAAASSDRGFGYKKAGAGKGKKATKPKGGKRR